MRIDGNVPIPDSAQSDRISEAGASGGVRPAERSDAGQESSAQLGTDSATISQLATQLGNFPAVRQDRVQSLHRKVQSGSYQVDAGKVAQSLLGESFGAGSKA